MLKLNLTIFILRCLLGDSVAQILQMGQCDSNIPLVENFDINMFLGLWHTIEKYPTSSQPSNCSNSDYIIRDGIIEVLNTQVVNKSLETNKGTATIVTADGSAKFAVTLPIAGTNTTETTEYWILATDYISYALIYSCLNINDEIMQVNSWKLSRSEALTMYANMVIDQILTHINVLDQQYFQVVDQSAAGCFYFPIPEPGIPVVFPGQCNNTIGPQNFDFEKFMGHWILISSYDVYKGTCNELTFSFTSNGTVVVTVTQVVNQQLETITGSAVFYASGMLSIEFPTSAKLYWILDTDYESYALIYSCENITSNQRRVSSWKMSRSKSLSSAANTAMDHVINSINVLDNRYYIYKDHSDDGCFFSSSEPDLDAPVIFLGQCDPSVLAFPNFSLVSYMGLWYTIESYPAPFQTGQCNRAKYLPNDNGSVVIRKSQVVNEQLETWVGSAVVTSYDGTAKLNVTFNINDVDVTINYWVLATDYISYALVYSCQNVDAETKAVYSWKLSRTKSLTAVANTVIDAVINSVQDLHQQYYIEMSHTEEDCHFEENDIDDDDVDGVLLPGQCLNDSLVTAVHYFNPTLFSGIWYEAARYPSGIQKGECDSSDYILNGSSEFTITHTTFNNKTQQSTVTQATAPNGGRGIISASIGGVPFNKIFILATDYREYALAYTCRNVNQHTKQIYSWKLSRTRFGFSEFANSVINHVISNDMDLFEGYYQITRQDDDTCPHYSPDNDDDDNDQVPPSVEFLGPCREIRGVPNFNAMAYLGKWYETARYSTPFQVGQCSRVEYALSQQLVVSKTEVVRQTLRTQTGVVGISNDGSGFINLLFNVSGEIRTAQQYILATDYTSYSLVYSCTNLDSGNSRVSSWKLSRTPTLSAEAAAAMSRVIAETWALSEVYYQPTGQSDQDCFYISS